MVRELDEGEVFKASPFFPGEMEQFDFQSVNFRDPKKDRSIADIYTSAIS